MTIPLYVVVAQWALLFSLGLLVIVMYRQLGWHLNAIAPKGELGPVVGSAAAGFEYTRVSDTTVQRFTPGDGRAAMVAFVDPMCPACEELVSALNDADGAGELSAMRVLLLISDPPSYLAISEPFRTTKLEVGRVLADATLEAYRARATPLLVAVDAGGVISSAGPATRLEEVRFFARSSHLAESGEHVPIVGAKSHSFDIGHSGSGRRQGYEVRPR